MEIPSAFKFLLKPLIIVDFSNPNLGIWALAMFILVFLSALLSGSEVAIFGLSNSQKLNLSKKLTIKTATEF